MTTSPASSSILVVDDESGIRSFLSDVLIEAGYQVDTAADASDALRKLEDRPFDLMFLDLRMPGELQGMDVLRHARAQWPELQIVVLTAHGTIPTTVEAMRLGAFDFAEKPLENPAALRRLAARAINWRWNTPPRTYLGGLAAEPLAKPRGWLTNFLWQLRRRRVYNVAATYAAACFIILQTAELLTNAVQVPDWFYPLLGSAALIGFPVALVFGWIYDITVNGVTRTRSSTSEA
jgi:CheY-like chemotaxis protein